LLSLDDVADVGRIVAVDAETTGYPMKRRDEIERMPKGLKLPGVVIQLGCVELLRDGEGWVTGRTWETLVQPDGPVHRQSVAIHGIHPNALRGAPRFAEISDAFEAFVGGDVLLAHAAKNEIEYLNYEMRRAGRAGWDADPYHPGMFLDTQIMARKIFPGASGALDVICDRLWIDRSDRFAHHGALLDAELTAEAFIKMATGFADGLGNAPRAYAC
jgi:DNA polymerase III epsilon subunit